MKKWIFITMGFFIVMFIFVMFTAIKLAVMTAAVAGILYVLYLIDKTLSK